MHSKHPMCGARVNPLARLTLLQVRPPNGMLPQPRTAFAKSSSNTTISLVLILITISLTACEVTSWKFSKTLTLRAFIKFGRTTPASCRGKDTHTHTHTHTRARALAHTLSWRCDQAQLKVVLRTEKLREAKADFRTKHAYATDRLKKAKKARQTTSNRIQKLRTEISTAKANVAKSLHNANKEQTRDAKLTLAQLQSNQLENVDEKNLDNERVIECEKKLAKCDALKKRVRTHTHMHTHTLTHSHTHAHSHTHTRMHRQHDVKKSCRLPTRLVQC